jgi:hypothetical protein
MKKSHAQFTIILSIGVLGFLGFIGLMTPSYAQGSAFATNTPVQGFATNTPESSQPIAISPMIATNTPDPSPTPIGPASGLSNYALRLWLEGNMIEVLLNQIALIDADSIDSQRAVQLLQYEMEYRFTGAPHNIDDRATIVKAMLDAPIGTIDMQSAVRPYIEYAINNDLIEDGQFEGFTVEVMSANLDAGNVDDAVIHILYPDPLLDAIRYEDYVLAIGDTNGSYRFAPSGFTPSIVPYNGVQSIAMERLDDVNNDGVDELAIVIDDGDLNKQLSILAYRGGRTVDLTRSGETLRFGILNNWNIPDNNGTESSIKTKLYQLASDQWFCISELGITWQYEGNFYRPTVAINQGFDNQNSFGCAMSEAEPLFSMKPVSATQLITDELVKYGSAVVRTDRAVMTLAMLYALDGQVELARETAIAAQAISNDIESWVGLQSELFLQMLNEPENTAFDICVALAESDHGEVGACDVKALLGRVFTEATFSENEPIATQLERVGLDVVQSQVISEVGRADRTAIDFGIQSAGWWAFVALDGEYIGTPIDTPAEFEPIVPPPDFITVPQSVYATLLTDNDPAGVINIIETTRVANPNTPFSEAFRFIEALSNDLLNNREVARVSYYQVWDDFPESIWGRMAGKHLELR